jgi:hypothetical protein
MANPQLDNETRDVTQKLDRSGRAKPCVEHDRQLVP